MWNNEEIVAIDTPTIENSTQENDNPNDNLLLHSLYNKVKLSDDQIDNAYHTAIHNTNNNQTLNVH
jgi:hypothetical protein